MFRFYSYFESNKSKQKAYNWKVEIDTGYFAYTFWVSFPTVQRANIPLITCYFTIMIVYLP
jgi:hypothetical protein